MDLEWGFASSPIIANGMVIVQADVKEEPFLAAWDVETGELVWSCTGMTTNAIPTRLATYIWAPNIFSWMAPTKARISPIRALISVTIGRASAPHCLISRTRS